ncbi:polyadenylate-binding protein-interacting protein 7 [Physcomitrium patens]|uniref:Smr domain-containing protein n=1 Tax=Physcomitrium patens TaxID=3218 RepID=A0A2K1KPW6_PHYPA|nr:polyadenylate-binding protein-interacting protein 7-like [Physcomitrium patens]XP_024373730.1 polyadenylate-binding protein-interacting protein 7-like [Physcomitrium patens]XP_024373731.1 polyadenylate-binding protein-interacting protein 7-like [Physcomitrium patens]PNR55834.1 hypothetical protein PHYPA_006731 [Physcomitrium patens]|eukprot:XP_024373729.1 polyadenylate-binding protein-interacting protein 7-like [Physcomitrella patens]
MGYNGREFREPHKMESTSNGLGPSGGEGIAASMSSLSIAVGDQSTSGINDAPGYSSNQSLTLSSSQSQSNPPQSTSTSSLTPARTNLNPHAAEFVPKAYNATSPGSTGQAWDAQKSSTLAVSGERETVGSRLDRTNSTNSNASDDEYRRLCRAQLPDDLMPDFDFGDYVESTDYEEPVSLEVPGRSVLPTSWAGGVGSVAQGEHFTFDSRVNQNLARVPTYSSSSSGAGTARYNGAEGSTSSMGPGFVRPYMPELRSPVQQVSRDRQPAWTDNNETVSAFTEWGGSDLTFPEDLTQVIDPVTVLATEFPGFASDSLAEIYYANGGDLALTVDMLTELELQNEGASTKQFQPSPTPAPTPPSPRDFPALAGHEKISGRASLGESRSVPDFAAAVRKQAAQQAVQLQFERNGGVDLSMGAQRGLSQGPGVGRYSREPRVSHNERLEAFHMHGHEVHSPVAWLETGDSVANMYSDMREEARDHARVRNAYFDQARQAYLTGNKALAKDLGAKGQWHNEQMKAAHSKAGEAIFWQRNSNTYANSPGQRLIDLHGLHVSEAIPFLKREIAQLRYNTRNTRQRETVFICVGTGHHTKGSRTPSRLPAAVQKYLLEEEHLQFTEPQAGMLRIILR